jgi:hypothetical protein
VSSKIQVSKNLLERGIEEAIVVSREKTSLCLGLKRTDSDAVACRT